jgi:hypothetical protein
MSTCGKARGGVRPIREAANQQASAQAWRVLRPARAPFPCPLCHAWLRRHLHKRGRPCPGPLPHTVNHHFNDSQPLTNPPPWSTGPHDQPGPLPIHQLSSSMDKWKSQLPKERTSMVHWSVGGRAAALYAAARPGPVSQDAASRRCELSNRPPLPVLVLGPPKPRPWPCVVEGKGAEEDRMGAASTRQGTVA